MKHQIRSHLLVTLQLLGVAGSCFPIGLINRGPLASLVFCALGGALGVYTLLHNKIGNFSIYPEIRTEAVLVTSGPYRYVRHPMYVALCVMMFGIALYNGHWLNFVCCLLVVAVVLLKASIEEQYLLQEFAAYRDYAKTTSRFIPGTY